ncbi:MAG: hypothetical protein WAN59_03515 [Candidatus Baltobacteraceae bacterium]
MSQHTIPSHDDSRFTVVVGYDRPLDSFFATVYNAAASAAEDEEAAAVVAWLPETTGLDELRAFCTPYATLAEDVLRELAAERVNRATHPMQKHVNHRR